jgi:hypothetical protein
MERYRLAPFLAYFVLGFRLLAGQQDANQLTNEANDHVERLETSVPNFICDERIVSQLFIKNKLKRETKASSELTTIRRTTNDHSGLFKETRAGMKINGKPSDRNEIAGPFVWHGGPAYGDLHFLFNSGEGQKCLDREIAGHETRDGRDLVLMRTEPIQVRLNDPGCEQLRADSHDTIWLDAVTKQVVRIESFDPPTTRVDNANVFLTVDYAPVNFDGAEYWLPAHFTSELSFPGQDKRLRYEAFFSNYHKFAASSVIHLDSDQ